MIPEATVTSNSLKIQNTWSINQTSFDNFEEHLKTYSQYENDPNLNEVKSTISHQTEVLGDKSDTISCSEEINYNCIQGKSYNS